MVIDGAMRQKRIGEWASTHGLTHTRAPLRQKWDGAARFSDAQLALYRQLQNKGGQGKAAGEAYCLCNEGPGQMPDAMLQTLVWSALPPPKGGRAADIERLGPEFTGWQSGLQAKEQNLSADH